MKVFKSKTELATYLKGKTNIGFVPTMGALHKGHISLIKLSLEQCQYTICSIFVNPTQFNDKNDLLRYPRTPEKDIKMLEEAGCDIVFVPENDEIYPEGDVLKEFDFGHLETVMEGKQRPGHFNGVANVVQRLFEIVKPQKAFFGQKDYQQLCIIKQMVKQLQLPIEIVAAEIIREPDGLAMSSRNALLETEERKQAAGIFETLQLIKSKSKELTPTQLLQLANDNIKKYPLIHPEYIVFANAETLQETIIFDKNISIIMFIAVKLGKVRLIDNMLLAS